MIPVTLMPIGRFAKASRLSVKSLRNYDESGLLPAAFVDRQTGYRYYRLEQLARADAIRSLRMVDMPLAQIAATLDGEESSQVLMSHLEALEQQRDELTRKAQQLQRRINLKEYDMSTDVTMKPLAPITAAAYRTKTTHIEVFNDIPAGFGTVIAALGDEVDPVGAPFAIFHQAPDGDTEGDIAMCVPVSTTTDPEDLNNSSVDLVTFESGTAASIIHAGSYDDMGRSYARVSAWIQERGHSIVGPTREIYLNSPADVTEAELRTELLFPIDAENFEGADR